MCNRFRLSLATPPDHTLLLFTSFNLVSCHGHQSFYNHPPWYWLYGFLSPGLLHDAIFTTQQPVHDTYLRCFDLTHHAT